MLCRTNNKKKYLENFNIEKLEKVSLLDNSLKLDYIELEKLIQNFSDNDKNIFKFPGKNKLKS